LILAKNELRCILGEFFTNSSGHPDSVTRHFVKKRPILSKYSQKLSLRKRTYAQRDFLSKLGNTKGDQIKS
jgi:hypothetical protein